MADSLSTVSTYCSVVYGTLAEMSPGSQDTDPDKPPDDPLVSLEKTNTAKHNVETVVRPRIEALQDLSEHYNADPYALSSKVRKKFREEKKELKRKRALDDDFKSKYSLSKDLSLVTEDDVRQEANDVWTMEKQAFDKRAADKRRALEIEVGSTPVARALDMAGPSSSRASSSATGKPTAPTKPSPKSTLASSLLLNSLRRSDPFLTSSSSSSQRLKGPVRPSSLILRR